MVNPFLLAMTCMLHLVFSMHSRLQESFSEASDLSAGLGRRALPVPDPSVQPMSPALSRKGFPKSMRFSPLFSENYSDELP